VAGKAKLVETIYRAVEKDCDASVAFTYKHVIRHGRDHWIVLYTCEGTVKEHRVAVVVRTDDGMFIENDIIVLEQQR